MTAAVDQPSSLLDIAVRRRDHNPSTPFLLTIDEVGEEVGVITYGQALDRAAALAFTLAEAGVRPGDRVGCYLSNSPSWVVASLAVWLNQAAVAAAGTLLPPVEAAGLFSLAEASVVVGSTGAPPLESPTTRVEIAESGELGANELDAGGGTWAGRDVVLPDPAALALAIFTSGTTGAPKGVTHRHADLVAAARRVTVAYARSGDYRPLPAPAHLPPGVVFNPFGHMAGYSRLAFRMWIGRPTVIVPRFTVGAVRALLARFEMDTLQLTPTMIHMLATTEESLDLAGVKYVTSGTAPLTVATRELFESRYGVPVMQAYGMSEVGAVAQERYADVVGGRRGAGSVGRLADGVEVRFRPAEGDGSAAGGVGGIDGAVGVEASGEILVRTDEASTEFLGGAPVPVDDEGWFATGDVGRMEDGILYITGRVHEKLIVGGFNVYPAEVEDAARRSPLVHDAVIVGLPDERLGERPVAGVVWAGEPDEAALLAELRTTVAAYKVPRAVFTLERVPLTPRDKVDRRQALALATAALLPAGASTGALTSGGTA